jgi:uncharacterized protein YecE (DUF72 family)
MTAPPALIGTAGWSLGAALAAEFPAGGSQLQRYARRLDCVEINSSFYRSHRPQTYERWAAGTPAHFRFAVKLPRQITHEARLQDVDRLLARFLDEGRALGPKWAVLLVQLPPSLSHEPRRDEAFFTALRAGFGGAVVCEPRHASWFTPEADRLLHDARIARAGVDPAQWPGSDRPGGWQGEVVYFRWHGSPRIYRSSYDDDWLQAQARRLKALPRGVQPWCIFDNTAAGAALANALRLQALL